MNGSSGWTGNSPRSIASTVASSRSCPSAAAFAGAGETRRIRLRSKADRIDLLEDGSLRIVDYKIGRAPDRKRSLQLPIYGACAAQALQGRLGRTWQLGRAGYVAVVITPRPA